MRSSAISSKAGKNAIILFIALLSLVVAAVLSISFGSTTLDLISAVRSVLNGSINADGRILLYVRLPRTIGCIVAGAALSTSGAVIQAVLRNRLASPGIIGVNSGAGLAVTVSCAVGVIGGWQLSLFAFIGAVSAIMIITLISAVIGASRTTVLLLGIALNSFFGGITDAVIAIAPAVSSMTVDFRIGDFSSVTYKRLIPAAVTVAAVLVILYSLSLRLDVLSLGEDTAASLGMNVSLMRIVFLIMASLLAASAVSIAGLLSFVGLIVPHSIKRIGVTSGRMLLPLCALFGGGFVTLCDLIARCAFAPYEIPVGIIMSFIGAPFFVFILIKKKGGLAV